MNITEFRQKYPQYNAVSDNELSHRLHAKYYSNTDYNEFATRFGISKFDPKGAGYDYETAHKYGIKPDETGHWQSRVPETGLILKGKTHPTFYKTLEAEQKLGYSIIEKNGRYYSVKPPAQQVRPEAKRLVAAQRHVAELPPEPSYVPEFAPVEPSTLPVRPLTSNEIYLGDLKKIYRSPGTQEQKEEKAKLRTRERLNERVGEIQAAQQGIYDRRRWQEEQNKLKGDYLAKTYRRWERGEVMVVGGGLHLAEEISRLATLGKYGDTVEEWARLMHQALQQPEMQPVIENTFDKYFGGAVETGPFLATAIGSAALTGGATLPASIAGFLVAYAVEGNNIYQTALDHGIPERGARIRGIVGGMINGGIEVAGGGGAKYLKDMKKAAALATVSKLGKAKYFSRRVLHTALAEGLKEEIPQEFVSTVLGADVPRKPDGSIDYYAFANRLIDAGIMGTMLGGAVDAPFSAYGTAKLPTLPKGVIIDVGNGRTAIPGVINAEANIISEESGIALNPWIKQDITASNKNRTLAIQSIEDENISWMGEVNNTIPKTDMYSVKDMSEAKTFLARSGYDHIIFNATDVTKEGIKELAKDFKGDISILLQLVGKPETISYKGTAYRVETGTEVKPDAKTAADVVRHEQEELGNDLGVSETKMKELKNRPATDIIWVTRTKKEAKRYGMPVEDYTKIVGGGEIISEIGPDGVLVLKSVKPVDLKFFSDLDNVKTYKTIQTIAEGRGLEYKPGTDLSHFESTQSDPTEAEIRTEIQTVDEAIGAQLGLTPTQVQDKLAKAEDRYRLLKNKDTDKRSKADRDELAFLSRNRSDIEALVDDYTSDKPLVRNLWKKPKKPARKDLLRKGHQIPEQMNMSDEERRNLQEKVTRTKTKPGKRSMAEMTKDELIKWVNYIEAELAARGEVYREQPAILPQLIERLETTAKIPVSGIINYLKQSRIGGLWADLRRVERWLEALDGYEDGPLHRHIWKRVKQSDDLRNVNIGNDQAEFFRIIEDQNIDSAIWCGAKQKIREGLELTPFQQIGVYLLNQNEQGKKYLNKGMLITDEDAALIENKLTEEQLAVATWLSEQYQAQWPVIRAAAIDAGVDPKLLEQELNYSPILRTDLEDDVDFVSLLTEQFNQQSLKPEQGFLEKRKNRAIGKIELDAGVIYMKNIQRIETFKAMAPIAKDLGSIFRNPSFKTALNNATDGRGVKILNKWLRDHIRGLLPGPKTEHAKLISIMAQHGLLYAIGFNIPSVMRQTLSLNNAIALDPLMLKYVPANLYEISKGDYEAMEQFAEEKSATVYFRSNAFDRDLRKKWDATALAKRLAGKTPWSEKAVSWIRWTDKRTVVLAWKSLYDVAIEKKMSEQEAIDFADQGITRTQPMASMKDLPHFFRGGTIERLLSKFQNQINNNLNFFMHDIIGMRMASKINNTEMAYRVIFSYIIPAIAFGIIGRGRLPIKDKRPDWLALGVDLATYPAHTLMLAGRLIARMIRGWGNSGTVAEIAPEEAIRVVQAARRGDVSGIIKHAAMVYGATTGKLPAQAIRTVSGAIDLAAGTTRDPRRLIYTQWALDQEKAKQPAMRKPRKQRPARKRGTGRSAKRR